MFFWGELKLGGRRVAQAAALATRNRQVLKEYSQGCLAPVYPCLSIALPRNRPFPSARIFFSPYVRAEIFLTPQHFYFQVNSCIRNAFTPEFRLATSTILCCQPDTQTPGWGGDEPESAGWLAGWLTAAPAETAEKGGSSRLGKCFCEKYSALHSARDSRLFGIRLDRIF